MSLSGPLALWVHEGARLRKAVHWCALYVTNTVGLILKRLINIDTQEISEISPFYSSHLSSFFKTWRLHYPQNNFATEAVYWTTCNFLWSSKRLYTPFFFTYAVMVPKSKLVELPFKYSTWVNACPTTGLGWVLPRFQAVFRLMRFLCCGALSSLAALLALTRYPSVMIDTE